jgi:hypothetical protein
MATAKKASAKKAATKKRSAKKASAKKAQSPRGRAQDRRLVAGTQKHEVRYEATKQSVPAGIVAEVVKAVGNARKKVEAAIKDFRTKRKPPARKTS